MRSGCELQFTHEQSVMGFQMSVFLKLRVFLEKSKHNLVNFSAMLLRRKITQLCSSCSRNTLNHGVLLILLFPPPQSYSNSQTRCNGSFHVRPVFGSSSCHIVVGCTVCLLCASELQSTAQSKNVTFMKRNYCCYLNFIFLKRKEGKLFILVWPYVNSFIKKQNSQFRHRNILNGIVQKKSKTIVKLLSNNGFYCTLIKRNGSSYTTASTQCL